VVKDGVVMSGFFASWLAPFPIAGGLYALALFAFLAATYLANEADTPELQGDFRLRALVSGALVGVLALVAFGLSGEGAPRIREGLTERPWTWPLHGATAIAAIAAFYGLWTRRFRLARLGAAAQVGLIILGWAASQYPYLVVPDLTVHNAAANPKTLELLVWALAAGSVLLFPSLYILYRIFKGRRGLQLLDAPRDD